MRVRRKLEYMRGVSEFNTYKITVLCRCPFRCNLFQHTTTRLDLIVWSSSQLGCPACTGWLCFSLFDTFQIHHPRLIYPVVNPGMCDDSHLKDFRAETATSVNFCCVQRVPFVTLAPIVTRRQVEDESFVCLKVVWLVNRYNYLHLVLKDI